MDQHTKSMSEIDTYYRKVDLIAAWEIVNRVPYEERLTYWFGDYAMDAPKYEHRDEIEGKYIQIISQGHPLLNTGSGTAVYRQSEEYARAHGEWDAYHESNRLNAACAAAIDAAVQASHTTLHRVDGKTRADSADGYDLDGAAGRMISEHGAGRAAWVLANVLMGKQYDGRISYDNRQWARAFPIPIEHKPSFALQTPSVILDGFASEARKTFVEMRELAPQILPGAKSSVMDQIREARKNPAPPSRKSEQDKGVSEPEI